MNKAQPIDEILRVDGLFRTSTNGLNRLRKCWKALDLTQEEAALIEQRMEFRDKNGKERRHLSKAKPYKGS